MPANIKRAGVGCPGSSPRDGKVLEHHALSLFHGRGNNHGMKHLPVAVEDGLAVRGIRCRPLVRVGRIPPDQCHVAMHLESNIPLLGTPGHHVLRQVGTRRDMNHVARYHPIQCLGQGDGCSPREAVVAIHARFFHVIVINQVARLARLLHHAHRLLVVARDPHDNLPYPLIGSSITARREFNRTVRQSILLREVEPCRACFGTPGQVRIHRQDKITPIFRDRYIPLLDRVDRRFGRKVAHINIFGARKSRSHYHREHQQLAARQYIMFYMFHCLCITPLIKLINHWRLPVPCPRYHSASCESRNGHRRKPGYYE